jgi:hypothetical protein
MTPTPVLRGATYRRLGPACGPVWDRSPGQDAATPAMPPRARPLALSPRLASGRCWRGAGPEPAQAGRSDRRQPALRCGPARRPATSVGFCRLGCSSTESRINWLISPVAPDNDGPVCVWGRDAADQIQTIGWQRFNGVRRSILFGRPAVLSTYLAGIDRRYCSRPRRRRIRSLPSLVGRRRATRSTGGALRIGPINATPYVERTVQVRKNQR